MVTQEYLALDACSLTTDFVIFVSIMAHREKQQLRLLFLLSMECVYCDAMALAVESEDAVCLHR